MIFMKRILIMALTLMLAAGFIPEAVGAASYTQLITDKKYTFTGIVQWHDAENKNDTSLNPTQAWLILDETLVCRIDDSNVTENIVDIFITCNDGWEKYIGKRVSVTGKIHCTDWALCQFSEKITTNIKPVKVELNNTSLTLNVGKTFTLKATISPKTAKDKTLIWSTSDKSIATVSATGKVKGIKKGTATITVKTVNGKTAKCKVTVK